MKAYMMISSNRREKKIHVYHRGVWERQIKKANWLNTKNLCSEALIKKTKDLQIASWLMESLLYLHGFTGLSAGLKLMLELSRKYWDSIYPLPTGNDFETRYSPFIWIDEKIFTHIKMIPIIPLIQNSEPYTYYRWEIDNKRKVNSSEDYNPVQEYISLVKTSTAAFQYEIDEGINTSLELVNEIKLFLNNQEDKSYPHFSRLIETLLNISRLNKLALKQFVRKENTITDDVIHTIKDEIEPDESNTLIVNGDFNTIEGAYQNITEISEFLITQEPNCPTGYIVKYAINYRYAVLKEFLKDQIKNKDELKRVYEVLKLN